MFWSWSAVVALATDERAELILDLNSLVQEAVESNPEIKAARQRWEAVRAVIPQVQTLPDPRMNFSYQDVVEREGMYGFSQGLPFTGK
jgi:outer membrane protein TolC